MSLGLLLIVEGSHRVLFDSLSGAVEIPISSGALESPGSLPCGMFFLREEQHRVIHNVI